MRSVLHRYFSPLFYFVAALATLLTYRNIAGGYLYNDDFRWMSQARYEMTPGNLLTFQVVGFFRPLMNILFFVTERVMPGDIQAYYTTNLALHLLIGLVVFHLVERLLRNRFAAAGTAILFLITSVHYAAVAWISARTSLVFTLLLLLSFFVLIDRPVTRWRQAAAVALYLLALAAKEEAVVGVLLLALIVWFRRSRATLPNYASVVAFAAATVAYVIVRRVVMGHFTQPNWGPGWHVLRNLGGGLLYQFYPWSVASLTDVGRSVAVSTHALWPEALSVAVFALLVMAGAALKRGREVSFALAWLVIALLPVAPFRIRFFTTDWLTHDRYYYLSSVGACLCIAWLFEGVWQTTRWRYLTRTGVVVAAMILVWGERSAVLDNEERFHRMTANYRTLATIVTQQLDEEHERTTCALQGWPMQATFMHDVFALERPGWKMVPVTSEQEAATYRPCLYVRLVMHGVRMTAEAATID